MHLVMSDRQATALFTATGLVHSTSCHQRSMGACLCVMLRDMSSLLHVSNAAARAHNLAACTVIPV